MCNMRVDVATMLNPGDLIRVRGLDEQCIATLPFCIPVMVFIGVDATGEELFLTAFHMKNVQ